MENAERYVMFGFLGHGLGRSMVLFVGASLLLAHQLTKSFSQNYADKVFPWNQKTLQLSYQRQCSQIAQYL